jgi:hypothetical protein
MPTIWPQARALDRRDILRAGLALSVCAVAPFSIRARPLCACNTDMQLMDLRLMRGARCLALLFAVVVDAGLAAAGAQAPLSESPINAGFWSFPSRSLAAGDVMAACRNHFEIRFADGHFIGLRARRSEGGTMQREVDAVGRCSFNRDRQRDECEVKYIHPDGSVLAGTSENKYVVESGKTSNKTLKMTVTPKLITDSPVDNAPYDVFPVRCPDEAVWRILNESARPK